MKGRENVLQIFLKKSTAEHTVRDWDLDSRASLISRGDVTITNESGSVMLPEGTQVSQGASSL